MRMSPARKFKFFFLWAIFLFFFPPSCFAETSSDSVASYSDEEISSLSDSAKKILEAPKLAKSQSFGKAIESSDTFEAAAPRKRRESGVGSLNEIAEEYGFKPEPVLAGQEKNKGTQMGLMRMWGRYRLAAGDNGDDLIFNNANSVLAIQTLQGPQSDYVFGEKLNNTHDPGIYNQYKLNVDFIPEKKWDFYTQIVIDPWSWVGTTGEQITANNQNKAITLRYNLKYFGAFNSTIPEIYRNEITDMVGFTYIKVHHGHLTPGTVVQGFDDYDGVPGDRKGLSYNIPELAIDTELRPFRKMWLDYKEDDWHARGFALADETQALTTDDPLELSNHHDYWQQSPWLYQYYPIQFFSDHSVKRGYYSDALSYYARDSEGNRLVLLRGVSFEGDFDQTYVAATVAAPYTPWDDKFFAADNVPGAIRVKQQVSEKLMLGATYTFRTGLIDNSTADFDQVLGVDTKYAVTEHVKFLGEIAGSHREIDLKTDEAIRTASEGYAYKALFAGDYDHEHDDGHTQWHLSYAQMDRFFEPLNSQYLNTRDDPSWGTHLSFDDHPDLEPFKLGDGLDINRMVVRFHWKEKLFKDRFFNEFDIRNVHKTINTAYIETVTRDELTLKINPRVLFKGLFRWRALPRSTPGVDPVFTAFYFPKDPIDLTDFYVQNIDVQADKNADQFTYSGGLQYVIDPRLTVEGILERTNAIPDFPRGLLNDFFRNPVERIDGILIDRMQNFMYFQSGPLKAAPPYRFFTITRERLIYRPESRLTYTLHAAQNGYLAAAGNDDNINHIGLGIELVQNKKMSWFADYTYSRQLDVPNFVATNKREANYNGHHNFYASFDYKLNAATVLRSEYGFFGLGGTGLVGNPYNVGTFTLPTIDTEHLFRVSLTGDF